MTPQVLRNLGHHVIPVNAQVSWRFPARHSEPSIANLDDFTKMVPELGVDFALAHDGDADRLVLVDRFGKVVSDSILAVLALHALRVSCGTAVISENSSNAVAEEAESLGLSVLRSRVGKTFAVLEAEGGVFAAEPSKIVDPKWGLWEDGVNAAALIADLLSKRRELLAQTVERIQWRYKQVNVDAFVRLPSVMEKAKEAFKRLRVSEERTLDGYKLIFDNGSWAMFRPSGTEPKTRLYCESKDPQQLELLVQLGTQCIESSL